MADVSKVISRLLDEKNWKTLTGVDAVPSFAMDAVVLLKSQQEEIERLKANNRKLYKEYLDAIPDDLD